MDVLLGIDMGTGSTKGVLVDPTGTVLATETIAHGMTLPRPGWAEVDAERLWWHEVCSISSTLMGRMPPNASLAAMCVSGVGPCLVLCDDDLRPLNTGGEYLDPDAAAEAITAVANQGKK